MRILGAAVVALFLASGAEARQSCASALGLEACYSDAGGPVGYDHAILGDLPEWTELRLKAGTVRFANGFFEDIAPVVADVTGDGRPEVLAVHSDFNLGARLVVLSEQGALVAATPFVGQSHRWFAQAGVGDFDGDGQVEIAYVDRPHLAKELVFVRVQQGRLREMARISGLTNHQIGDNRISGGVRNCGSGDEVVLASGDWLRIMAVRIGKAPRALGAYSATAVQAALRCRG